MMTQNTTPQGDVALQPPPGTMVLKTHDNMYLRQNLDADEPLVAYISIGAGETHVTLLDQEGNDITSWTAVIGWTCLFSIGIEQAAGQPIRISSERDLGQALKGALPLPDGSIETTDFIASAVFLLKSVLRDVVAQTISLEKAVRSIVLAAPVWLHECLRACVSSFRDDIHPDIVDLS